jgi:hypothetical protein
VTRPAPIDPRKIWIQGDAFYQTLNLLCNVDPDNQQLAVTIGEPVMVIGSLTVELFFKCLACIETGRVPRGHYLRALFDGLSHSTRARIESGWDGIARYRAREWDHYETLMGGTKIARDLPSALTAGSNAFEKIRYSYEGGTEQLQYYLQDLPILLGRIILEMKPEWEGLRRGYQEVAPIPRS